jgi:hypothetical protein
MLKRIGILFALAILGALILVGGLLASRPEVADAIFEPDKAGIRMIDHEANMFVDNRAPQIQRQYLGDKNEYTYQKNQGRAKLGDINPYNWFVLAMGAATEVRDDRRRADAVIARANDRDQSTLSTEVKVNQWNWETLNGREIRVPTRITVVGMVRPEFYAHHQAAPDGIPWAPAHRSRNRTVLMNERNLDQPTEETGNLNEAIIRLCDDKDGKNCRWGLPIGSEAVICVGPDFQDGGYFQGWYNGLSRISGGDQTLYFTGTERAHGKFKFVLTPDYDGSLGSTQICNEHKGALFVKTKTASTN